MDLAHSIETPTPGCRYFKASFLVDALEKFKRHVFCRREAAVVLMEGTRSSCMDSSDFFWRLGEEDDEPLFMSSLS